MTKPLQLLLITSLLSTSTTIAQHQLHNKAPRVIIVGAGASGLAAAQRLMLNGVDDIIILEAMDRVGGRIFWQKLENNTGVDLGAHWIHGEEGNTVYEIADSLGLVRFSGDYEDAIFLRDDGSHLDLKITFGEWYLYNLNCIFNVTEAQRNLTFPQVIDKRIAAYGQSIGLKPDDIHLLQRQMKKDLCTAQGCSDLQDVSLNKSVEYDEGSGTLNEWVTNGAAGGMSNILYYLLGIHWKRPGSYVGMDRKILLNSRVAKIDWSSDEGVTATTSNGVSHSGDFLIFTPSLNVLKTKHRFLFKPPLPPAKVQAINALEMDVVDKVYLVFSRRWWPTNVTGFIPLQRELTPSQPFDWGQEIISFISERHNPLVLGAWLTGKGAKAMERTDIHSVRQICMSVLRRHVGSTFNISEPINILRSSWWSNPDILGAYSYNSVASEKMDNPRGALAKPLVDATGKPVVLFAGEATSRTHYGSVNGAIESGWREAQRILNLMAP